MVSEVPVHSWLSSMLYSPIVKQHIIEGSYGGPKLLTSLPGSKIEKEEDTWVL